MSDWQEIFFGEPQNLSNLFTCAMKRKGLKIAAVLSRPAGPLLCTVDGMQMVLRWSRVFTPW